jgi:hypothetical protein
MHIRSFGRSAAFAALVALAFFPWLVVVAPVFGLPAARAFYLVAATALYAGGLAQSPARRASVAVLVAVAGLVLAVITRGRPELCLALAVLLGTVRSVFLHRAAPARAVATEALLVGGGLVFARFLAGDAPHATSLALWGFFLVQSCFFLVAGVTAATSAGRHPDPFEDAFARASEVMDRRG